MIEELANTIIKKVSDKFPQISIPTAMRAKITSAKKTSKEYKRHYKFKDLETGEEKEYEITGNYYIYSIKIINTAGTPLERYPSIPNVESQMEFLAGDNVTVVFIGGSTTPEIVGG